MTLKMGNVKDFQIPLYHRILPRSCSTKINLKFIGKGNTVYN
jgi:hypothetical protein